MLYGDPMLKSTKITLICLDPNSSIARTDFIESNFSLKCCLLLNSTQRIPVYDRMLL